MRHSLLVFLLLSCLFFSKSQGIRLGKISSSVHQKQQEGFEFTSLGILQYQTTSVCGKGQCKGTLKKRVHTRAVSKKSHHWIPSVHEDYYGPTKHRPRG